MQFVVIGRDAKDDKALERRMESRAEHIALCDAALASGNQLYGAALLDDEGKMCGSVMVFEMPSRAALDEYLKKEPYVTNRVWGDVEVIACKTGPSFEKIFVKQK